MRKLFVFIVFFMMFCSQALAEEKTVFSIDKVKAVSGDTVSVSVSMDHNPKFGYLSISVGYDVDQLTYVDCSINGFSNAMMKGCTKNEKGSVVFYALTIYETDDKLMDDTGDIFDIQFEISEAVTEDIPLTLNVTDYGRDTKTNLDFEVENASIEIVSDVILGNVNDSVHLYNEQLEEYEREKIIWSSSDSDIASVDEDGIVTFKKEGDVTIVATTEDGDIILEKSYKIYNEKSASKSYFWLFGVSIIVVIILILISFFIIRRRKKMDKRNLT